MAQPPLTYNLKVIFTINDILSEVEMSSSILKILLCDTIRTVQLPCTNPVSFEFPQVQTGSKIEFDLEDPQGNVYGYSELSVPEPVFHNREIQMNQQIPFYLNNSKKEFITAKVFITFLNTEVQQSIKQYSQPIKPSSKLSVITSKSPNQSMSSPQKKLISTPPKEPKIPEKSVQAFVDSLFQKYSQEIGSISKRHADSNEKNNRSKVRSPMSSQTSLSNLHAGIASPTRTLTPKDLSSRRDNYSSVNSTINDVSNQANKNLKDAQKIQSENKVTPQNRSVQAGGQKLASTELKNHLDLMHKNRSNSMSEKQRKYNLSIDRKPLNSSTVGKEIEQSIKFATFCPNSLNPSSRDHSIEVEKNISQEKLTSKLMERVKKEEKKTTKNVKNRSQNSSLEKYNSVPKSSTSEINMHKTQTEQQKNAAKSQDSQLLTIELLKKENEELKLNLKKYQESSDSHQDSDLLNKVTELERKVAESASASKKNLELSLQLKNMEQQYERMQSLYAAGEQRREEERKKFTEALLASQKDFEETRNIVNRLTKEKKEIKEVLQSVKIELEEQKETSYKLKDQLLLAEKSSSIVEKYCLVIESLKAEKQDLIKMLFDKKKGDAELGNLLQDGRVNLSKSGQANEEEYLNEINGLKQELRISQEKVGQLLMQIASLKLRISEFINEGYLNKSFEERLGNSTKLNLEQTQEAANIRLLQAERNANELRDCLNEKDEQIENLKSLVIEARQLQEIYVPSKDDPIDDALAEYINNKRDIKDLKFLFIRESKGRYEFAGTKINIKLEGKELLINMEGKCLSIEEFLNKNLRSESEKLARSGSLQVATRSVRPNKITTGKSANF